MMGEAWFKPKTYGYGAAPANWKGWAATAGYVTATWAILWPGLLAPAFVWLCRIKTDGPWEWRWGDKK